MRLNRYIPMVMMGAAALLTGCSEEELGREGGVGGQMPLTVKVSRTSQPDSRTVLTETTAGLSDEWSGTETLLAFNQAGDKVGELQFVEYGADKTEAVFQGTIDGVADGQYQYRLWYLGATVEGVTPYSAIVNDRKVDGVYPDLVKVMLNTQSGKFADLVCGDLMNVPVNLTVQGQKTYAETTVTMSDCLAMARFHINGAEGVTDGTLTIAYENGNIPYKYYLGPSTGENIATVSAVDNALIVSGVNTSEDVYVVLPPSTSKNLKFTLTSGEDTWTYTTTTNPTIEAGVYYCNATEAGAVNGGFVLDMVKEGGDEPEDPNNPGNMNNWGLQGENIDPKGVPFTPVFASRLNGWTLNSGNSYDYYGGYCRAIEYTNGLYNGLLTSQGASCFYFQWGRYLGFPSNTATGNTTILNANSVDLYVGYRGQGGIPVKYLAAYMGNDSKDNIQRSYDWSIVFGQTNNDYLDYIYRNEHNENWFARSENPCPTGYRLPTYEELSVFIPSTEVVTGSYAEVKTINGTKYAMKWVVGSNSNISYVDVTSVKTKLDDISVNSSEFNNEGAVTKRIYAYGYLMNNGKQSSWGTTAAYWSSDSGTNNALDDVTGKGGRALYIEFSGSTANFAELNIPFGFGLPVMPIKDDSAVEASIKPWLPYSYDMRDLAGYNE